MMTMMTSMMVKIMYIMISLMMKNTQKMKTTLFKSLWVSSMKKMKEKESSRFKKQEEFTTSFAKCIFMD